MSVVTKELSPGLHLHREEETGNQIVYSIDNTSSDLSWRFTLDFTASQNFQLLKPTSSATSKVSFVDRKNVRRIVVPSHSTLEVARLRVVKPTLESSLKVSYAWEECAPLDTKLHFADFGTAVTKREALSTDVDLLTTRTDSKDGHTKFVYKIKSQRRESLKVILDFSESRNLVVVNKKTFFSLRSSKKNNQKDDAQPLVKEIRVTKGTTRVAKLRTVKPKQGWVLNHNVTFEMKELHTALTNEQKMMSPQEKNNNKHQISEQTMVPTCTRTPMLAPAPAPTSATEHQPRAPTAQLPSRPTLRRISISKKRTARSSAGFESGLLVPMKQTLVSVDGSTCNDNNNNNNIMTDVELLQCCPPMDQLLETNALVKEEEKKWTAQPQQQPSCRMSWLDAEIYQHVNGDEKKVTSTHTPIAPITTTNGSTNGSTNGNSGEVKAMLESLHLVQYYEAFVREDFDNMSLLQTLANDDKNDFRQALKVLDVEKIGEREKILRFVLSL